MEVPDLRIKEEGDSEQLSITEPSELMTDIIQNENNDEVSILYGSR